MPSLFKEIKLMKHLRALFGDLFFGNPAGETHRLYRKLQSDYLFFFVPVQFPELHEDAEFIVSMFVSVQRVW